MAFFRSQAEAEAGYLRSSPAGCLSSKVASGGQKWATWGNTQQKVD